MAGKRSAIYGALTDSKGRSRNVEVYEPRVLGVNDRAGYAPQRLDDVLEELIKTTEQGAELLQTYTPMLQTLMQKLGSEITILLDAMQPTVLNAEGEETRAPAITAGVMIALELAGKVSTVLERVNKMAMQSSKSVDTVTRLRTFLMTGDDDADSLSSLGESDLRRIVANAASGFKDTDGWAKPQEAE